MKKLGEWWCPDILSSPGKYTSKAATLPEIIGHARGRRRVIQAGAHIGVYPRLLSQWFANVEWFEAAADNYECAAKNTESLEGVTGYHAAIGDEAVMVCMSLKRANTATHHVSVGSGVPVKQVTIDSLGRDDVDAILLDVEGYEIQALRGARETILKSRPLLVVEVCRYIERYGHTERDLVTLLSGLGYSRFCTIGADQVWTA